MKYIIASNYLSGHNRRRELGLTNKVKVITRLEQLYGVKFGIKDIDVVPDDVFSEEFLWNLEDQIGPITFDRIR